MLSKIYLLLLVVFALAISVISFSANSWLSSIGDPTITSEAYQSMSSMGWTFLWVSFLILAGFSLVLAWKSEVRWAIGLAMGYFVASCLAILYNDSVYKGFLADNSIPSTYTLLNPFFVAVMFLVVAVALIAAYVITANLKIKIKGIKTAPDPKKEE